VTWYQLLVRSSHILDWRKEFRFTGPRIDFWPGGELDTLRRISKKGRTDN